jgi:peptide/nickel transport system substrate-binding protein
MSIHEEATIVSERPMMGVFNNLVMFDQQVKQNSLNSIAPDLATGWSWSEDRTELTFPLRQGVTWHDGKPFTAEERRVHLGDADRQGEREVFRLAPAARPAAAGVAIRGPRPNG